AAAQIGEEEALASREHVEAARRERVEHRLRVGPIARAVLHPGDRTRIRGEQAGDQVCAEPDLGDGRDVIQVDAQSRVAYSLDDLREGTEQTFVTDAFVIEGRQHQNARASGA